MSWHGGTEVAESMICLCSQYVPPANHKPFLVSAFNTLECMGWDTPHDIVCGGDYPDNMNTIVKEILVEMHPDWYEFEDEEECSVN